MTAPVQPWRWIRLEIGLAVNGGIQYALFINHPLFWPAVGLSSLLIALLLLWPAPAPAAPPPIEDVRHARYWRSVAEHVNALLPLWAGHVALGREQIDQAASQLTERFDHLLRQIDHAPALPPDAVHPVAAAQDKLENALESLQLPPPLQKRLTPQLEQLKATGHQLQSLARSLIESNRVPTELSAQFAEQIGQWTLQLESLDADIHASCLACRLKQESADAPLNLQATIEEVLIHLQFQDRVNQILSHVQNDIWQLETLLHESLEYRGDDLPEPPDTEAWLSALKASYTTHEQRALHNREHHDKAQGPNDITFF
ncbi:hypothetical protein [Chromobacterium paludis]|uniref:Uncharacterized protein n=1 Tax=Chromobacterium paludis TaxID=2605945 RepID=A0A5C1DC39_9NEIS|nr:hypothetical protein [Chromobacterium paludis]QEL54216.1 hypothetical protein FYK34_00760 [Chromobacterium paludis]